MSTNLVTVVIPTWNAGADFAVLMQRLHEQILNCPSKILVLDSGSHDDTLDIANRFGAKIHTIPPGSFNHGGTRNWGVQLASSPYVCLMTQDAIPQDSYFLARLLQSLEQYQAAGVYARQVPRTDASPLVKRDVEAWISGSPERRIVTLSSLQEYCALPPMQRYLHCVFDNVASLIRRDIWEKIPFPHVPFGEDLEWAYRALVNGHTIVYEPDAVVEHSHERSSAYTYKRTFIDHYRLYELFGLRTVPTRRHAWLSFAKTCISDWDFLLRNFEADARWLKIWAEAPRHAWGSAWGQYEGARTAARGIPQYQSRDV